MDAPRGRSYNRKTLHCLQEIWLSGGAQTEIWGPLDWLLSVGQLWGGEDETHRSAKDVDGVTQHPVGRDQSRFCWEEKSISRI